MTVDPILNELDVTHDLEVTVPFDFAVQLQGALRSMGRQGLADRLGIHLEPAMDTVRRRLTRLAAGDTSAAHAIQESETF